MKRIRFIIVLLSLALMLSTFFGCTNDNKDDSFDYLKEDMGNYVKLGQYTDMVFELAVEISDSEVDSYITRLLLANQKEDQITDRAVKNGDTVNIDFTGYMNDVAFEGGSAQGSELEIGSGHFIAGFEEGLIDVMPGEEVSLDLTFPDPYPNNPDYAGKGATFVVKVNYIVEYTIPDYSDEFVQEYSKGEYTNTEDYSRFIKSQLEKTEYDERSANRSQYLLDMAIQNSEILERPKSEYDKYYNEIVEYYTFMAAQYKISLADFMSYVYNMTESEFYKEADKYADSSVSSNLVSAAIAQKENITLSNEEYNEGLQKLATNGNTDTDSLEKEYGKSYFVIRFLKEKVKTFLVTNNTVKE